MSPVVQCPTDQKLSEYALGRLSDEQSDALAAHVTGCAECQARIDTVGQSSDTLLKRLRRPPPDDAFLREPQCQQAAVQSEALARELLSVGRHAAIAQGEAMARGLAADDSEFADDSTDQPAADGSNLGCLRDYRLLRKLGQGGMGTVYEALHTHLNRHVAVKVLSSERMRNSEAIGRFRREMQAIGRLDHPNIVRALDAGEADGKQFLAMEFVDGLDLATIVKKTGPLPVADACELVRQAATGLQYVHENDLVHRDIKPSNLMATAEGQVKLLDLGLALLNEPVTGSDELTTEGQVMGTLDYMAPEQLGDAHTVDHRADIYSLGATLYKLLSGRAPYADRKYDTATKKLVAIATKPVAPIEDCRDDIPAELTDVLDRMLAKNPDDRYATALEVAEAVSPLAEVEGNLGSLVAAATAEPDSVDAKEAGRGSTFDPHCSPFVDTRPTEVKIRPQPAAAIHPPWRRGARPWLIATALLLVFGGSFAAYEIIITIRDKMTGKEQTVKVPDNSEIIISRNESEATDNMQPHLKDSRQASPARDGWLSHGLVGHWTFDEENQEMVLDSSGNENHGQLFDGEKRGKIRRSRDVPATSTDNQFSLVLTGREHVMIPHSPLLNANKPLTLAAWVKMDTSGGGSVEVIRKISLRENSYIDGYLLGAGPDAALMRLHYSNLCGNPKDLFDDRDWHHIAGRWSGNTVWACFVDGEPVASDKWFATIPPNEEPLLIGRDQWGHGMVRLIDDVRVYHRALSDEDIRSLAERKVLQRDDTESRTVETTEPSS